MLCKAFYETFKLKLKGVTFYSLYVYPFYLPLTAPSLTHKVSLCTLRMRSRGPEKDIESRYSRLFKEWYESTCLLKLVVLLQPLVDNTNSYIMPVPLLTPNLFNPTTQALLRSAYNRCLDLEYRYEKVLKHGRLDVLVCARMLGYMIIESPTEEGRTEIASEIMRYTRRGDKGLQTLAETYLNHFIRICEFWHGTCVCRI